MLPDRTTELANWPNTEIKGRIRRLFEKRILSFIYDLVPDLSSDSTIPILFAGLSLLLAPAQPQATLGDFTDEFGIVETGADDNEQVDESEDEDSPDNADRYVLIYTRVSSNEQKEDGRSLESQKKELKAIIIREPDMTLYTDPIEDDGVSGTDFDREGIQKVARLAQNDEITHLLVDSIDRLGRTVPETLMFIHQLRAEFEVKIMTRNRELDVLNPTDRMEVTMLALMGDLGTMNRARSSLRSSADNFLKNKQWRSWYTACPLGYEWDADDENYAWDDDTEFDKEEFGEVWIRPVSELKPLIRDVFKTFIDEQSYKAVADKINERHEDLLDDYNRLHNNDDGEDVDSTHDREDENGNPNGDDDNLLTWRQVKSIVSRPVYMGSPTIPVTELEHYEPYPSVEDPELKIVSEDVFQRAQSVVEEIKETYSEEESQTHAPADYAKEFDPRIIESVSQPVRLVCPECDCQLIANGQYKLNGGLNLASRMYQCSECDYERRWPRESEQEMMNMLSKLDEFHSLM